MNTVDIYDTVQADCAPSRYWRWLGYKPYILYPWVQSKRLSQYQVVVGS
ncbi:MAG: hypothetical protein SCARUB_04765 [Candidatus Scalindua rubra]|uniref:Uncharacterized protein n=1 Tax=Candidatus Scalindua rubra TaxID=1872076 RepID=A0A1E3X3D7_9BACT|nr:MAG: hypothetical protein SCARUB_04765 [Candidatus Scalindua rubra]